MTRENMHVIDGMSERQINYNIFLWPRVMYNIYSRT